VQIDVGASASSSFNVLFCGITRVGQYQKKTSVLLDFYGAGEDNGGRGTDSPGGCHPNRTNGAPTPTIPQNFLQAGCPSCRPTNSVKALKALKGASIRGFTVSGFKLKFFSLSFQFVGYLATAHGSSVGHRDHSLRTTGFRLTRDGEAGGGERFKRRLIQSG